MKLAITGGYGQVGQEFQKYLSAQNLILLSHAQIEVSDLNSVSTVLKELDFDIVVNLAAFHKTDQCEVEKEKTYLINSTILLLKMLLKKVI